MLGAITGAIRAIIDLLKKRREDKKVGLEIEKLEREKREEQKLVKPATLDDVRRYDPKINLIREKAGEVHAMCPAARPSRWSAWMVILALVVIALAVAIWAVLLSR
jgi:hypothetical protein